MASEPIPIPRSSIERVEALRENVEQVLQGKPEVVELSIAALLARGHLLLEDVPGVGKTTLAHALARSIDSEFQRVQFTSDLMPSDIIGVTIFSQDRQEFEFVRGPLFTNVLLADEINRATPKTQSALLEAMSEGTVSIEQERIELPHPFLVIATQNPVEHSGTYPLPESQRDRFMMRLTIGYPSRADEKNILRTGGGQNALARLNPVMSSNDLRELQEHAARIHVSDGVVDYMLSIVEATRHHPDVRLGVSTRGTLTLHRAVQALAMVRERDYVVPDDVKEMAVPVLAHRIVLRGESVLSPRDGEADRMIRTILTTVAAPR